jgi:hypothetical protein
MTYFRHVLNLCKSFDVPARLLYRWLAIIALAKITWLVLFIVLRGEQWAGDTVIQGIGLFPLESEGYYVPLEDVLQKGEYSSLCRMPGLLPFYLPLRMLLSQANSMPAMIGLQVIFDILATWSLGVLAARIFQSIQALRLTYLLACLSTFTAVRNNYLLSDSLCISLFVLSLFSLSSYFIQEHRRYLIYAGIGCAIALFLRPVMLVIPFGIAALLFMHHGLSRRFMKGAVLLLLPSIIALGSWTLYNRLHHGRAIVIIAPLGECMPQMTPDFIAIREWILASGGDYQPWATGGESHWFFDSDRWMPMPFGPDDFTPGVDSTMLLSLKHDYHRLHSETLPADSAVFLETSIIARAAQCRNSYISEHPTRFYLINKLKFARMILFPKRIDDLPFPPLARMNLLHKIIKSGSLIAIPLLSLLTLSAILFWIYRRRWVYLLWMCLPMGLVLVHSYIGFVEQRYLATSYPLFLLLVSGFLCSTVPGLRAKRNPSSESLA